MKSKKAKRVQFQDGNPSLNTPKLLFLNSHPSLSELVAINSPPSKSLLNRSGTTSSNSALLSNLPLIPLTSRLFDPSAEYTRNSLDDSSQVLDCRIAEKIKTELSEFKKHRANTEQELNLILNRNAGLLSRITRGSDDEEDDNEADDVDSEPEPEPEDCKSSDDENHSPTFYEKNLSTVKVAHEEEALCLAAMKRDVPPPENPKPKRTRKRKAASEKKPPKPKSGKLDVRRAPLGGKQFSLLQQQLRPPTEDLDNEDSSPENELLDDPEFHRNSDNSNDDSAIKVDLKRNCSFCDEPHAHDECPLRNSTLTIEDAIEKALWIEENQDVFEKYASRLKPETDESEILVNEENDDEDDNDEDDEEDEEETDSKIMETGSFTDERTPKELDNLPTFSDASLPAQLDLVPCSDSEVTVVTRKFIPKFTKLGPLIGQVINVKDIPDDCNMKDIYEVFNGVTSFFVSTENRNESNWMRLVRPAPHRDKRNLSLVWLDHENNNPNEVYFVTCKDIDEGCELLYWSDDVNSAWGRKKIEKMSKTIRMDLGSFF